MADPINSNANSKSCGEITSSNCIAWAGGLIDGITICKGATITDVITALGNCCSNKGTNSPCYTGNWIDISSVIPLSGSGPGYTYTIFNFGGSAQGNPSYKWTKEGNLLMKGSFSINLTSTSNKLYIDIPFLNLPANCLPISFKADQYVLTAVDFFVSNDLTISERGTMWIEYPTGKLSFNYTYADPILIPMRLDVGLGGIQFNLE